MIRLLTALWALTTFFLLDIPFVQAQYKQTIANKTKLVYDKGHLVPLKRLDKVKIAVVTPDLRKYNTFVEQLGRYADISSFDFSRYDEDTKYFNLIIVAGTEADLNQQMLYMLRQSLVNRKDIILCRFEDGVGRLQQFSPLLGGRVTELSYPQFSEEAQRNLAMSVFGGLSITEGGTGNRTEQTRLQYSSEGSGLNISKMGQKIDQIAEEAIREKAAPGMVVMAIKNGQVIFEKAYGTHTYDKTQATKVTDIFDLASVSKIAGTTPVVMHLQESGIINLDSTMGHYLWQARQSNKANITLRTVLLHEAGFTPYIPFYRNLKPGDMQSVASASHQVKVADNAYLRNNYYRDVMWPEMLQSAVKPIGNYVYSDISMYVMKEVAEHETAIPMEDYIQEILYQPIGMKGAGYNPRERFEKSRIIPTENDTSFRKVLLEGYVHDQGAAMAGGVAGHAGLFSTANDLAIYGQLLLNRGEYGGVRYFKPGTVDLFTSKQSKTSRRGLGFDRADLDPKKEYPSRLANASVYGHTGYTGTCIWIDPKHQLIYIFLSNRVHPQVSTKLYDLNVRSRIQDAIYETINEAK
ncbi:CubicO group peptidase, beta-lactamase class C family [Sphingobacterium nematocida]|uniref:CubicO group peptidase, beta-lactamase class C family n=1 Tax=Sphingobacterium nematocida TaxID=1513896 RepID=A0A1T5G893_9SPHI|nr:serine hydrolase domain-containing protein [Sphingobacterium nematocida]SKC04584.1 CubicO group peptidase, beta-lactamase class C family [Sphingobacterium nematocida]